MANEPKLTAIPETAQVNPAEPPQVEPAQITNSQFLDELGNSVTRTDAGAGVQTQIDNPWVACEESTQFRTILLLGTIVGCLMGNLLLPWFFWESDRFGDRDRTTQVAFFASGGLTSQLAVLGLWSALGPQAISWRFLATSFLATLSSVLFVVGLMLPDLPTVYLPTFTAMFLIGTGVVGFLLATGIVGLVSLLQKERIVHSRARHNLNTQNRRNYSLGYLIGLTTAVAVLVALLRSIFPSLDTERQSWAEIISISILLIQHAIMSILMMLACAQLVLRTRHNWLGGLYILAILFFVLPINLALMQAQRRFQVTEETVAVTLAYTLGFGFFCAFYLLLIRLAGYRLMPRPAAT